jgi:hypothetical protein
MTFQARAIQGLELASMNSLNLAEAAVVGDGDERHGFLLEE